MTGSLPPLRDGRADGRPTVRTAAPDDGPEVSYADYGAERGRPVLFLHGTPGSRLLGELFDVTARERGVRVLAPDRPGYGRSPSRPDRTLAGTDRFVVPVLRDAGVSEVGVVGFSGGGPHALALAAARPDLVDGVEVVSGAVPPALADDRPAVTRLLGTLAARAPRVLKLLLGLQVRAAGRLPPSFVTAQYTAGDARTAVPDPAADLVARDFLEAVAGSAAGAVAEFRLLNRPWDLPLDDIDAPVRFRHGGRDTNVPVAAVRRFAERFPTAETTVLPEEDHLTTLLRSVEPAVERFVR
jgi:pimeloyl-ACP methyl ester carboxylesterase